MTDEQTRQVKELARLFTDTAVDAVDAFDTITSDPRWNETTRVHDWRNYVPTAMREAWVTLHRETQLCIYIMAEERASNEIWD